MSEATGYVVSDAEYEAAVARLTASLVIRQMVAALRPEVRLEDYVQPGALGGTFEPFAEAVNAIYDKLTGDRRPRPFGAVAEAMLNARAALDAADAAWERELDRQYL